LLKNNTAKVNAPYISRQSIRDFVIHTRISPQANLRAFQQFSCFSSEQGLDNSKELGCSRILNAHYLNQLKSAYSPHLIYSFIEQQAQTTPKAAVKSGAVSEDNRYYEEIIYQDKTIPTRNNSWHDYFNGMIWLTFGQTKAYLNSLHWRDIAKTGHKKRSAKRDRITHFDECGMVLVTDLPEIEIMLKEHDWQGLFVDNRHRWFNGKGGIVPLHFGHANLEMLREPFIGLTAKTIVMQNADLLKTAHKTYTSTYWNDSVSAAHRTIDSAVLQTLQQDCIFDERGRLMPMPILGIPEWHNDAQDQNFYHNKTYFMPKRP
jgi:hypothetical protein